MRTKLTLRTKRSIHVATATIMFVAPASALALSGATATKAADVPLHATVSPRVAQLGQAVTIRGSAPASAAGHRAVLESTPRTRSPWRPVGVTTIRPDGRFAFRTHLRHSGYLRVLDSGPVAQAAGVQTSQALALSGPTSSPQRVAVAARFAIARRRFDVLGGQPVTVRGTLNPGRAGRLVRVEAQASRGWRILTTARTGTAGRFRARVTPVSGTGRRLRVRFAGDRGNAPVIGAAGLLTVFGQDLASWYNDAGTTGCGFHATYGVANRSLPCGTKVRIRFGGRSISATVDDRGPYAGARNWDLNQNTAAALGFGGVGTIWVSL